MKKYFFHKIILSLSLVILLTTDAFAWPAVSEWVSLPGNSTSTIEDPIGDATGSRDIVGDATYPAGYMFNDGTYMNFRMRINDDPVQGAGLSPFGWGILFDTDIEATHYEWMILVTGVGEELVLAENTDKVGISQPSDVADTIISQEDLDSDPSTGNYRVTLAGSNFSGDPDYFLDFRISVDLLYAFLGIDDSTPIRLFLGSSNSGALTLTADVIATTLNAGLTPPITTGGTTPSTATVSFVSDLSGAGDETVSFPTGTLYIRVDDGDQNYINSVPDTITVTLTVPSGDSETITLTETGVDTGIFTASIVTAEGAVSIDDGVMQVVAVEVVTATFIDLIESLDDGLKLNQPRTDTITIQQVTDLEILKSVDFSTPDEGDTIVYTLSLTNYGPSSASGIQVTDLLPAGVTYDSDDGAGSYNDITGVWSIASINTGVTSTLNITATVDGGTSGTIITNSATITTAPLDNNAANDVATRDIAVGGIDLEVTKSVDELTPYITQVIIYTVTVTNTVGGTNDATNLIISDVLSGDLSFVSKDPSQGTYNEGSGDWSVGTLLNGDTATLTISATVDSGTSITNTASVGSVDQVDFDPSNDSDSVLSTVGGAELDLTKSVGDATPNEGDTITYTVSITNNGSNDAGLVEVTDLLPSGLTYTSYTATTGMYSSFTGIWSIGTVVDSTTETLTIDALVDAAAYGATITNSAIISNSDQLDPISSNNNPTVDIVVESADLLVTKTVDELSPAELDTIVYTITVKNNGPVDAVAVEVTDLLPAGVTYSADSPSQGSYVFGTGVWTIGTITNGSTVTIDITADVDGGTDGTVITNTATVTSTGTTDSNLFNNIATQDIYVGGAELSTLKTVDNLTPAEGDTVTYTITITNNGPNDATNVEATDVLPSGVVLDSNSTTHGTYKTNDGSWSIGTLLNGETATLTLTAIVDAATNGTTIINKGRILSSDQGDSNLFNNVYEAPIYVGGTDLVISKVVDDIIPTIGDTVTYSITVLNSGPNTATTIEVYDVLPAGVTFSSYSSTQGLYSTGSGIWSVGTLTTSGTATLDLLATVDVGTGGSTITNYANLWGFDAYDPVDTNDSASVSIDVKAADLAISKVVDNATPDEGTDVVYTITLTNLGPNDTTGVIIDDMLPVGTTFVSYVASQGMYTSGTGVWDIGAVNKLDAVTLDITVTLDNGTGGTTITNTATLNASNLSDPNAANDSDSIGVSPNTVEVDMVVTKTVDDLIPTEGDTIVYTITALNSGPNTATGIEITDNLPAGVTFVSYVSSQGLYTFGTGVWSTGVLINGASATLDITATVDAATGGTIITNSAAISALGVTETNVANDSDSVDIDIQAADIGVTKTVDDATPAEGDTIVYSITAYNSGPDTSTGIVVTDNLPAGVTFVSYVTSQGLYTNGTGLWAVGTLANSATESLFVTVTVDSATGGSTITNSATVTASSIADLVAGNDTASVDINPLGTGTPDIILLKSSITISDPINLGVNPLAIPGGEVLYTITTTNQGLGAVDVDTTILTDNIPANTEIYVGAGSPVAFIDGANASGLNFTFTALGNGADDVEFDDGTLAFAYTPVPDADGYDANVTAVRVNPKGVFNASDGVNHPSFEIRFKVRVQ